MSKAKFYVGQIIKRQTHENAPIGPFMMVQVVERDRVYADVIGHDVPNEMILKKNVYRYSIDAVCISENLFERLTKGQTICAQHLATKQWLKVWASKPELIRFYTQRKNYQAIFVVENITKTMSLGEHMIRIIVDNLVV